MKSSDLLPLLCALLLASPLSVTAQEAQAAPAAASAKAPAAPKLHAALRDLWHGHIVHARDYAYAVRKGDTAAAKRSADAVVANARQIADAVGSYYGAPAGARMFELLGGHWGAVKAMTDAEHAGNAAGVNGAMGDLTANAGQIASFLSDANPYLPADAVRGLLVAHGAHHAAQIREVMKGDTQAEQRTWVQMQAHMNTIADALADAIARQFPAKAA